MLPSRHPARPAEPWPAAIAPGLRGGPARAAHQRRLWGGWQRGAALLVVGLWAVVGLARASVLAEPAATPPGAAADGFYTAAAALLPAAARYLYLDADAYAGDPAIGPRLRYELAPRSFDAARVDLSPDQTEALLKASGRDYVLIPTLAGYPHASWLRERRDRDWYVRREIGDGVVLERRDPPPRQPARARR